MFRRGDPRFRRTLNQLSQNLESANESAQESLYAFAQRYLTPCLAAVGECVHSCTEPCFPSEEEQRRRRQQGHRPRGRAELSFDFYDDWDEEQDDPLGWGNDELEHLLSGPGNGQPGRERAMNYGALRGTGRSRRRSVVAGHDGEADPTIVPTSSYFGFLERFIRPKGVRYKPSAADLQEHPGSARRGRVQDQAVFDEDEEDDFGYQTARGHKRVRSGTNTSGHTSDSRSSRGDIFPSEDELDDAVPLDDEFATHLERRTTSDLNDGSSGIKSAKGSSRSRLSMRTVSSRSTRSNMSTRRSSRQRLEPEVYAESSQPPTLTELKAEEDEARQEEELLVERKRKAAKRLTLERGLSSPDARSRDSTPFPTPSPAEIVEARSMHSPREGTTSPFPAFNPDRTPGMTTPRDEREGLGFKSEPDTPPTPSPAARATSPQSEFIPAALPRFDSGRK